MSLNSDHELSEDLLELEQQLGRLMPMNISAELFSRLECSMTDAGDHTLSALESFEKLEIHLQQIAPSTMPGNMIERMVSAMDNWHERVPVEEKLVDFDTGYQSRKKARKRYGLGMLSSAAAVAILGAVTALMMTGFLKKAPTADSVAKAYPGNSLLNESNLVFAGSSKSGEDLLKQESLTHKITNTIDQGVVLAGQNMPHRCIRVEYVDRVKVRAADGREVMITRPGVEYVLIPVETY